MVATEETSTGHPIDWQGRTLFLGEITPAVKAAFLKWARPRILAAAKERLPAAEYFSFRMFVLCGGLHWRKDPSPEVAVAIATQAGTLCLHRLLFGDAVKEWSDDYLWAMLEEKDQDAGSDYRLAFDDVWDASTRRTPTKEG